MTEVRVPFRQATNANKSLPAVPARDNQLQLDSVSGAPGTRRGQRVSSQEPIVEIYDLDKGGKFEPDEELK